MTTRTTQSGVRSVLAALLITACPAITNASEMGQAAADQVSQASYIDYLDNWLYTHWGDDRGFGPEHDLARDNIAILFESYGLTVTLEPFLFSGDWYYNVVGTKLGTLYPDQEYIVGAHFDSVGNPGADDDASGVALLLEASRIITQYESDSTIRFVAFDREEQGLWGSSAYVDDHLFDDIRAMVQADMIAYDPGTDHARIHGDADSIILKGDLLEAISLYGDGLTAADYGWMGASDHAPFAAAGFEACLLIESEFWNNPYYHAPSDTFENPNNLNFDYAIKMVRSVVGYVVDHAGVQVRTDYLEFTYPDGRPEFIDPAGGTRMPVVVTGHGSAVPVPATGLLHYEVGAGWQTLPLEPISDNVYDAVFPAADCGEELLWHVTAQAVGGEEFADPEEAPESSYSATAALAMFTALYEDFTDDVGWAVSGDATSGHWEQGTPTGGGSRGDPPTAYGGAGRCYLTWNVDGNSDVDEGSTYLDTHAIDLEGLQAEIEYALWYTNDTGSDPSNDLFRVYLSRDGGEHWTLAETVGPLCVHDWTIHRIRVSDFITPTPHVRVRFEASDLEPGSVVEAAVDDFRVLVADCDSICPPDVDGDGIVDVTDLVAVILAWGQPGGPEDINGDGTVDVLDLNATILAWGPCSE